MDNGPNSRAWKLKHELIIKSIKERNDFDLDEINQIARETMKDEEIYMDKGNNRPLEQTDFSKCNNAGTAFKAA